MAADVAPFHPLQIALDLANARMRELQAHVLALEQLLAATSERADKVEQMLLKLTGGTLVQEGDATAA